jgi:zinc/manganese transport system permease protein
MLEYNPDWSQLLNYPFVQNALLNIVLTSIICGLLSYFIILRKQVFYTHSIAHIGFPGAAICLILGFSLNIGLLLFCIAGGLLISLLNRKSNDNDLSVSAILCFSLGLGVFLSLFTDKSSETIENILFGSPLGAGPSDCIINAILTVVTIVIIVIFYRPLLLSSISPEIANSKGINNNRIDIIFILLISIATASSILIVGSLLVFCILVLPASISYRFSAKPHITIILSIVVAIVLSSAGFILSLIFSIPVSFPIVLVYFVAFLISKLIP